MKIKKIFAGIMALNMVAAMGTGAFAETVTNNTYDKDAGTVDIVTDLTTTAYAGKQMTVIIVPADENGNAPTTISDDQILYINQEAAKSDSNIFQDMSVKGGTLADGTYYIKIGGEDINADGIIVEKLVVTSGTATIDYYYGDVNGSGGYPDLDDAVEIINYYLWEPSVFDDEAEWRFRLGNITADRETNDAVDLDDAVEIINYYLWEPSTLDDLLPAE